MSPFGSLPEIVLQWAGPILGVVVVSSFICVLIDRILIPRLFDKKAQLIGKMNPKEITGLECPYEYFREVYGKYHWASFVHKLSPNLQNDDHSKYLMVLEIMDTIHLCLMLVDDISDGSEYRKGRPAAHNIYGPTETANRAYYRVTQILNQTIKEFPNLAPWLTQDLQDILEGQDMSLVWRRDGIGGFPIRAQDRVEAYRRMASLKTGSLFRLLGHLVLENDSMDETFTVVAWYSQLQNDCKNVYSSEYAKLKGLIAEDLYNREMTYPIVLALDAPEGHWVTAALESPSPHNVRNALKVIRSKHVRKICTAELERSGCSVKEWLELWGRTEKLDLKA
ncbi:putative Geranylgeranyl diphosphate synthase [Penicillium brasilianum]|uniref:Putative Geranylgeranyl diphosphate synthase n=1 Tax=Penicillium brasilianum TaxID=104259 RepID=A0A1S9RMW0_PENBI|nr:putative Geranylgeranyl diphosphate synthase [Penicillium brasilianum]